MTSKKLLSGILCVVFLFASMSMSVSALTFSDVENDPTVEWAKPYINKMADIGYIKGYEDGTFKPNNTISKTEALILLSRMIGVNDEEFAGSLKLAREEFADVLSQYSTNYENEVSFLLYAGILDESDLDSYISTKNKNAALKRYEVAVLLTKLLGAAEEVEGNVFVSSSYADTLEIPSAARAYVEYVKEAGIMQGMGNNKNGQPEFWPNSPVTRSQMAKMLYTLIDVLDLSTEEATVAAIDAHNETITFTINGRKVEKAIDVSTEYKLNGKTAELEDLTEGMDVKITYIAGKVALIENIFTIEDTVVYGLVASTKDSGSKKSITIADANDKKNVDTYILSDDAKIRVGGAVDLFSKVKANNYVALTIVDGLVAELDVIDKTASISGTLIAVEVGSEHTVLRIETPSGAVETYEISDDGVLVSRNSLDSSIGELMQGDSLGIKTTYGKVTKITASSKYQSISGSIASITHSTTGTTLTIERNNKTTEYKVNKSVKILIDSTEEGTVFDLRPGSDVNVELQSNEIISIEAAGSVAKSQYVGTIKTINTTYGLLIVEEGGTDYNIYINSNTKIIDSVTGKSIAFKNITKGRTATITGSNSSGIFEANVIVLQ